MNLDIFKSTHFKQRNITFKINSKGCMICTSHKPNEDGYVAGKREGKNVKFHRYYYEKLHGKLPDDIVLLHKCDMRNCINIFEHLIPGTHQDNMTNMKNKGRSLKGEKATGVKLKIKDVKIIRKSNESSYKLAKKFKVNPTTIQRIKTNKTW